MAFKDGLLVRVLEDHEDVEGLDTVKELLCIQCNQWYPNPTGPGGVHERELHGELVTITGLKGKGTIKTVATGLSFPFHYATYEDEVARHLKAYDPTFVANLKAFAQHHDHQLAIRAKEEGNPNTWVYRINHKRLWKALKP